MERNEEVEKVVAAELTAIDPLLGIRWFETAVRVVQASGAVEWEGRYGLTVTWAQVDKRWVMYRSGDIGEPFDILGWFCEDLHDASTTALDPLLLLDEVRRLLGRCDNAREGWKVRMKRAAEHNMDVRRKALDATRDETHTRLGDMYYHREHGPAARSYGGLDPDRLAQQGVTEAD